MTWPSANPATTVDDRLIAARLVMFAGRVTVADGGAARTAAFSWRGDAHVIVRRAATLSEATQGARVT